MNSEQNHTFIALLRGINVGGNSRVEMSRLKAVCEKSGFSQVRTYINSGNVIFTASNNQSEQAICTVLENAIQTEFGFSVPLLVLSAKKFQHIAQKIPAEWVNNSQEKSDVLFLWPDADSEETLSTLQLTLPAETGLYVPGAILWNCPREFVTKSKMLKVIGTKLYTSMTVRNCNTVRRLNDML